MPKKAKGEKSIEDLLKEIEYGASFEGQMEIAKGEVESANAPVLKDLDA